MVAPTFTTTPLSNMSFSVNWTIDDSDYMHTFIVTWTNLCDNTMMSETVSGNKLSVTVLNDMCNYNVCVGATCGMNCSDNVTVYGKN